METKDKKRRAPAARKKPAATGMDTARRQNARARRSRQAQAQEQTKRTPARRSRTAVADQPGPEVVYTPAKPFRRNRFLLRIATVVAVVLALILGISLFFKVEVVTVSGADKYTPYMVQEASGIQMGDKLLTLDKIRASGKIIAALPYVEHVRIGIELPGTVNIEIKEMDVVYSVKDSTGLWWLLNSSGRVIVSADSATAGSYTQLLGVTLQKPVSGQQAEAADVVVSLGDNSQTTQNLPGGPRLSAALSILQYLEDNSIIGSVASVDVTDLNDIQLWYGQQYQVKLGDTTQLGYKIQCMKSAIAKLEDYQEGVLDISFTNYPDEIKFSQFP